MEGVKKALDESSDLSEGNKTGMLSYLEEANRLLVVRQDDFPRSSSILQSQVHDVMAKVHRRFSDTATASKWESSSLTYREAAKLLDDEMHLRSYASWLLEAKDRKQRDSYKCTDQWELMTTSLVTLVL